MCFDGCFGALRGGSFAPSSSLRIALTEGVWWRSGSVMMTSRIVVEDRLGRVTIRERRTKRSRIYA